MRRSIIKSKRLISFVADDAPTGGAQEEPQEEPQAVEEADSDSEDDKPEEWDRERAAAKIREANREAKALRQRAKAAEEKANQATDFEKRAADAEAKALRLEIGYKLGLPIGLADRLKGSTEEELIADAKELMSFVSTPAPASGRPQPNLGGVEPQAEPVRDETDLDKIGARMFRR